MPTVIAGLSVYVIVAAGGYFYAAWFRGYETARSDCGSTYEIRQSYDHTVQAALAWPFVLAFFAVAGTVVGIVWLGMRPSVWLSAAGERSFRRKREAWLARQPKATGGPYRGLS